MDRLAFLSRLAQVNKRRIVLLILDGLGDLRTAAQPETALELAATPNLDHLAKRSALGRIIPVAAGVTPGSGPAHLSLFGYDPTLPENDIGRGVLEALGAGLELGPEEMAARGNFATADADGNLTDRRAGRIPTEECRRLVAKLNEGLAAEPIDGLEVEIVAGEGHRSVLILRASQGGSLSAEIEDTDPQKLGVPPLAPVATKPEAAATVAKLERLIRMAEDRLADEARANRLLLRGFSKMPHLPPMGDLYKLRCGAFAGYPLYRGVAKASGMEVLPCGKHFSEVVETAAAHWDRFDYFFLHIKQTDARGEDGDIEGKAKVIEEVDRGLPDLLALEPAVLAVTGDHSTPAPMAAHSWHPVPLLLHSDRCFIDDATEFTETACLQGHLGTFPSHDLMALLLANAGRLAKFGA